jgi:DNA-binding MarR family transcriptional regulator
MTARVGPTQATVLLCLADGNARTVERIETDMLLPAGRVYGALQGLARRGYVDRRHELHERGASYYLTDDGQALAEQVHDLAEPEEEPEPETCPHGRPMPGPPFCPDCRDGLWRCNACAELVAGGKRGPHLREKHGRWQADAFTWADQ